MHSKTENLCIVRLYALIIIVGITLVVTAKYKHIEGKSKVCKQYDPQDIVYIISGEYKDYLGIIKSRTTIECVYKIDLVSKTPSGFDKIKVALIPSDALRKIGVCEYGLCRYPGYSIIPKK